VTQVGWLVGWLVGWSVDRLIGRSVGWLVGRSVSRSLWLLVPLFCRNLLPLLSGCKCFCIALIFLLTFQWREKTHLEVHFVYLGKNKFKTFLGCAALFLFYFPQNVICFMILSFLVQITCFFINCPLKFQYQPGHITLGYLMYMFVHIRKVFPKKCFYHPPFLFWKAAFVIRKIWRYVGSVWRLVFLQLLLL